MPHRKPACAGVVIATFTSISVKFEYYFSYGKLEKSTIQLHRRLHVNFAVTFYCQLMCINTPHFDLIFLTFTKYN